MDFGIYYKNKMEYNNFSVELKHFQSIVQHQFIRCLSCHKIQFNGLDTTLTSMYLIAVPSAVRFRMLGLSCFISLRTLKPVIHYNYTKPLNPFRGGGDRLISPPPLSLPIVIYLNTQSKLVSFSFIKCSYKNLEICIANLQRENLHN